MAEQTTSSITINASPEEVMEVISDLEAYPEWVDNLTEASILTEVDGWPEKVRLKLQHPMISDEYTLAYTWWEGECEWHLVEGKLLKTMDGSYTLTPEGAGTKVTYALTVDITMPMPGMLRRKAEKTIIDGALKGLKERVEG